MLAGRTPALDNGVRVDLDARDNSGQTGFAMLVPAGKKTRVVIDLAGAPERVAQPASIHVGRCDAIGSSAKRPLKPLREGRSITVVPAAIDALANERSAILVRGSGAPRAVACGNFSEAAEASVRA